MSKKTRYLQLSDTMMMEYNLNDDTTSKDYTAADGILYTHLKDGHYAIFSPLSSEMTFNKDTQKASKRPTKEILTTNTLQHLAVPTDTSGGNWYTMIDSNNEFITADVMKTINCAALKAKEYASYCTAPVEDSDEVFYYFPNVDVNSDGVVNIADVTAFNNKILNGTGVSDDRADVNGDGEINAADIVTLYNNLTNGYVMPRWDSLKLYLVNGYDFSDVFGILAKIYVKRTDGKFLDLCNFFFTKNTAYELVQYLAKPIIFGNFIYDRYIEINLMSIYDLCLTSPINDELKIKSDSPIRLTFSYVNEDNFEINSISYTISELAKKEVSNTKVSCEFTKSVSLNGTLPTEKLNSDNLGVYIAQDPQTPYFQFYGTWKNYPLTFDIVQNFNKTITLYDTSLVRKTEAAYEVDNDYQVELNLRKWIAVHDITCTFFRDNEVIKTENYSMTQVFTTAEKDDEITKFYYRPLIFDEELAYVVTSVNVDYVMKFINVDDRVQFTKYGALSTTDVKRFYAKGTQLGSTDLIPYKVYNKIIESKQVLSGSLTGSAKTKYVKMFYNTNDVILYNGDANYSNGTFTLQLSRVSKNYKFVFKNKYANGTTKFFDLSNGYYKLYIQSPDGNITIEPTYSTNMNLTLGEIEFNISNSILTKLSNIDESSRYMSIVACNDDNSVSSMYDFSYTF